MQDAKLKALGERIEAAEALDPPLESAARAALADAGIAAPRGLGGFDTMLGLVEAALDGWAVSLDGTAAAAHGHWTCTLRRSRERDNDEVVGVGHGRRPAQAMLAALIEVLSFRAPVAAHKPR